MIRAMSNRFLHLIFILVLLGSTTFSGYSQCGTMVPSSHRLNPPIMEGLSRDVIQYDLNKTLSVHIYIVASSFNSWDYSSADYLPNWEEANSYFELMGMTFEICSETLIPNYQYNFISDKDEPDPGFRRELDMRAEFYTDNVINVYYVGDIDHSSGLNVDGYAYFPGGADVIVLKKDHGDLTIEHELGHFFGLYHTFETDLGLEFVDGSNCESSGDLVCDTPADNDGNINQADCQYNDLSTDANGDHYTPYLSNIMSYYGDCRCKFSVGQYNRMAWTYLNERNYLW